MYRGERGKIGQQNFFCPLRERALFYLVNFFYVFGLHILAVINFYKFTKIVRNRKIIGVRWDRLCPKWDKWNSMKKKNNWFWYPI